MKLDIQMFAEEQVATQTTEPKVEGKTFTQEEVDNLIKDRLSREKDKFAKDLGIGEEFNKEEYSNYKKFIESQKTEAQKLADKVAILEKEREDALRLVKQSKIEKEVENVLKSLEVDTKHSKTILKLVDLSEMQEIDAEFIKSAITNTINEELPMLINSEKIKIGSEKQEDKKPTSTVSDYLKEKYKNNPYYKG
jgi:hypothetical protein